LPERDPDNDDTVAETPGSRSGDWSIPPELRQRFDVIDVLGSGGMGAVLRVRDRVLGREVALKLMLDDRWTHPEHRSRFLREARAAATLDHPNIITVHDVDEDGRFLVMELACGGDLRRRIKSEGGLAAADVKRIGVELSAALAAAHAAGVVHRDVKPSNVLFDPGGAVRLADFGIASIGDSDLTVTGTRIGTPAYMAPEQLRGRAVDHRADVYAAGASLFEAITGGKLHGESRRVRDVYGAVQAASGDRALAQAIAVATMEQPEDRFQTAADLATALLASGEAVDDLAAAVSEPLSPATRETLIKWRHRRRRRRTRAPRRSPWLWVGGGGLLVGAIAAAAVVLATRRGAVDRSAARVAVVPAEIHGDRPELIAASREIPTLLVDGLSAQPHLELLAPASFVPDPQPDSAAGWIAAARAAGAARILTCAIRVGDEETAVIEMAVVDGAGGGAVLRELTEIAPIERLESRIERMIPIVAAAIYANADPPLDGRTGAMDLADGLAATQTGDWKNADRLLSSALARDPTLDQARYYLAIVGWWWSAAVPRMRALTSAALASDISEANKEVIRGLDLLIDSRFFDARDHFEKLAAESPADRHVLYGLIEARFHSGDPAGAMEIYRKLAALVPEFQPGFVHAARYYLARRDREGFDATAGTRPRDRPWQVREKLAFEGVGPARDAALAMLERRGDDRDELRALLAELEALSFRPRAARVYLDGPEDARARWAIALVTGDSERVVALREVAYGNAGALPEPWRRRDGYARLALIDAAVGTRRQRRETLTKLAAAAAEAGEKGGLELRSQVARALLAGAAGDGRELGRLAKSSFPEVAALAGAYLDRRARDHAAAAEKWRAAIAHNSSGYAHLLEWMRLAEELRAQSDHAGALDACDQVIAPALFDWSWAGAVRRCLAISVEAASALGQNDRAAALLDKVKALDGEDP
jgi:tRNA A-37 threonylcarbamoyl transferase component Bud32/tetratricopeptide (TPR) repeat protein